VYRELQFPEHVYEDIQEFYEETANGSDDEPVAPSR
jgi:hypothetical protein